MHLSLSFLLFFLQFDFQFKSFVKRKCKGSFARIKPDVEPDEKALGSLDRTDAGSKIGGARKYRAGHKLLAV